MDAGTRGLLVAAATDKEGGLTPRTDPARRDVVQKQVQLEAETASAMA